MSARTWIPAAWMDEVVPTCGASPDAFLKRTAKGVLQLAPIDPDPESEWPVAEDLQPGQEIEFCWHADRGSATLHLREDGTWFLDPPFEDGEVNCINDADGDIIADSVGDYIHQRSDPVMGGDDSLEPGEHQLWGWYWSDGIRFCVRVLESGAASFEEVLADGT